MLDYTAKGSLKNYFRSRVVTITYIHMDSYETILDYIRTTTTKTGLDVEAYLSETVYEKGVKITDEEMNALALTRHAVQPKQNYTLRPQILPLQDTDDEISCQRTVDLINKTSQVANQEVNFA